MVLVLLAVPKPSGHLAFLDDSVTNAKCPDGFGTASKLAANSRECTGLTFLNALIQTAIANDFYSDCTSSCIFDTDWPLHLNFMYDELNECWNPLLTDGCEVMFPDVAAEMYERADLFCTSIPQMTPVPTVAPTDHGECDQTDIDDGSHVLLSIDS